MPVVPTTLTTAMSADFEAMTVTDSELIPLARAAVVAAENRTAVVRADTVGDSDED
jgi:hypothetical protein